ncbi:MAG: hypothetical protein R8K53_08200 [Mariprofundaceae bacterium]
MLWEKCCLRDALKQLKGMFITVKINDFIKLQGEKFTLSDSQIAVHAELVEVKALQQCRDDAERVPFSLVFEFISETVPQQGLYRLTREPLDENVFSDPVFLVPIQPGEGGRHRLEAVFS